MKKIVSTFVKGIFVLAPIVVTLLILYKVYELADGVFKFLLLKQGIYFPGLGLILTLVVIFSVGLLANNLITSKILAFITNIFEKTPVVKTIYTTIKDTVSSFSDSKKGFSQLVMVSIPNSPIKLLGFLTNDEESKFIQKDYCSVYLMQSMQWAGNLIVVPKELVTPVDATSEEAIKFIASAGLIK